MNWIAVIFLLLTFSAFVHTSDKGSSDVVELTDLNFDDAIKNNPIIMVKFFAPGCGHCKRFKPEYEKAARMIKEQKKPYVLAKMDATDNSETSDKYDIQSYPTVKLFIGGTPTEYEGDRTAEAVISFIDRLVGPPSFELNVEQLKEKKAEKGLRVFLITAANTILEHLSG